MATEEKRIQRIIKFITEVNPGQIAIEPDNDIDLGFKMTGYQDDDGTPYKCLAKGQDAIVANLEASSVSGSVLLSLFNKSTDDADNIVESTTREFITPESNAQIDINTDAISAINSAGYITSLSHSDLSGDNNSDATEQHYDSVPVVGTNAIEVTNPNEATDNFLVATRDLTLIKSGESITGKSVGGAFANVGRDRFFVALGDDDMYAFDTHTGKKVDENLTDFNNRALLCKDDKLFLFGSYSGNMVVEIDQNDLSEFTNIAVTGLPGAVFDAALKTANGSIFVLDSDGYISVMSSAYIITATFSVESAGRAQSLCFSKAENSIFVLSVITEGDAYVKEFDISGTLLNTSAAISGLVKQGSRIRPVGDKLCVYSAGKILYFDPDNIDGAPPSFMSSAALPGGSCVAIAENVLYRVADNGSDVEMAKYQLPALTLVHPDFVDSRGGGGVKSADGVFESDGVTLAEVSKQDEIRSVLAHVSKDPYLVEEILRGTTNTAAVASDSTTLKLSTGRNYNVPVGELFSGRITITASVDPACVFAKNRGTVFDAARWEWDGIIAHATNASWMTGGPAVFTLIYHGDLTQLVYAIPTINMGVSSGQYMGDIILTVEHTQFIADGTRIYWTAVIDGVKQPTIASVGG